MPLVGISMSRPPLPTITFPVYSTMREKRLLVAGIALYGSPGAIELSVRLRKMPFDVHFCQRSSVGTCKALRTEGWENQFGWSSDWFDWGGLEPRIELANLVDSLGIDQYVQAELTMAMDTSR